MSNIELKKANQMAAIDLLINNPELNKTELANELNMTPQTIHNWFADDRFVEMYYKQYMISFNAKLPMVLNSMVREAVEGNVQAGRLVLEHSGKLVKNINVTVDNQQSAHCIWDIRDYDNNTFLLYPGNEFDYPGQSVSVGGILPNGNYGLFLWDDYGTGGKIVGKNISFNIQENVKEQKLREAIRKII